MLRHCTNPGIKVLDRIVKYLLFADDCALLCESEQEVIAALYSLDLLAKQLDMKFNASKSKLIYYFEGLPKSISLTLPFSTSLISPITDSVFKYLGRSVLGNPDSATEFEN